MHFNCLKAAAQKLWGELTMAKIGLKESAAIILSAAIGRIPVFAGTKNIVITNVSVTDLSGTLTGYAAGLLHYLGAALLIWGAGSFIMSTKTDDANQKHIGIMCAITGAVLFAIRWFLREIGLIA